MNIDEHTYTITTSTSYTFNYFQIQSISVISDTTISVQVQLFYVNNDNPEPLPTMLSRIVNQIEVKISSEKYSTFTPSDLYQYVADYILGL